MAETDPTWMSPSDLRREVVRLRGLLDRLTLAAAAALDGGPPDDLVDALDAVHREQADG